MVTIPQESSCGIDVVNPIANFYICDWIFFNLNTYNYGKSYYRREFRRNIEYR